MLGAIAGDIIGSVYEGVPCETPFFYPLFHDGARPTDDTVLTLALADSILSGADFVDKLKEYYLQYPYAGYGGNFQRWARSLKRTGYDSWGNGSAMRVSPVGWAYDSLDEVLQAAEKSAEVTHNHPEGIKGAQATASAIFLARTGSSKDAIRDFVANRFEYDLTRTLDEIRPTYTFDVSCQGSVPESVIAFLESTDYEDAVRKAISLGGDADTQACITGGMAEAFYGSVPNTIRDEALVRLNPHLLDVFTRFEEKYL